MTGAAAVYVRLFSAVVMTASATMQWQTILAWAQFQSEYSPEIIAAVHAHKPIGQPALAITATAFAAVLWVIAIWTVGEQEQANAKDN